ncbi:DUF4129 domain-containing protein [Antarcticibacterium sp. 1MA-6-2]|uniref:DUF4129 domain-containing protein n=1 Tax=Antarcticibacterium sp. 1MA-6-2 TaxID=2908210 RepID=UPI001F411E29|nr:DUF4129 domain-containing protein [Antarcticibacterium sp. 1MA-6-2]UJH92021.1 DUF4129 domain-containing protein [Antarcticibacterium sp. 1MA-6-2]
MNIRLIILLLFFYSTSHFAAQDSVGISQPGVQYDTVSPRQPVEFDSEKIEAYKEQSAFAYLEEVENDSWWTRFKRWLDLKFNQLTSWLFGEYEPNSFFAFLLRILPYLIIGLVLGFFVWLFLKLNPGASILEEQKAPQVSFNEEEELVRSGDISELIENAINSGDYRLAVRYYYLQLLRILDDKDLINYEYQKTDSEYLAEVNNEFKSPLKKIMRLYDFIWYGNFPVTAEDFSRVQSSFLNFKSLLKPSRK